MSSIPHLTFTELAEQDSAFIKRMREMQQAHQAGEMSAGEFDRAWRALNAEVDAQCSRCGGTPAPFLRGTSAYCGRCYQETAPC